MKWTGKSFREANDLQKTVEERAGNTMAKSGPNPSEDIIAHPGESDSAQSPGSPYRATREHVEAPPNNVVPFTNGTKAHPTAVCPTSSRKRIWLWLVEVGNATRRSGLQYQSYEVVGG